VVPLAAVAAQQPAFSTGVDAVVVDVLITRDGRPVTGLTASDFTLRDNGVTQRVESIVAEDVPITLLLLLDTSASVSGEPLAQLKVAVQAAGAALRPQDRVGLFTFSDRVRLTMPPGAPNTLPARLQAVQAGGATALYDAIFAAMASRSRTAGRALVLLFSDGDDTVSWLDPRDVIVSAQRSDTVVHAVTLRRPTSVAGSTDQRRRDTNLSESGRDRALFQSEPQLFNDLFLQQLVNETGGSLLDAASADLSDAFVRFIGEFKARYVLTYTPRGVAPSGWHTLDVKVNRRAAVRARRGYLR
jgi:Ca-activated chloride channel family protein